MKPDIGTHDQRRKSGKRITASGAVRIEAIKFAVDNIALHLHRFIIIDTDISL